MTSVKEDADKNNAYACEELEQLELVTTLKRLQAELADYHTYIETRVEKASDFKSRFL